MRATFKIQNVSGSPYLIEEIDNHVLANQEIIDLIDPNLTVYYDDREALDWVVTKGVDSKLYQSIQVGDIEVIG